MVLPVCQLWILMMSLNQYPKIVQLVHVRLSRGVTSRSTFDQVPGGAQLDSCFCKTHPSMCRFLCSSSLTLSSRAVAMFSSARALAFSRSLRESRWAFGSTEADVLYRYGDMEERHS